VREIIYVCNDAGQAGGNSVRGAEPPASSAPSSAEARRAASSKGGESKAVVEQIRRGLVGCPVDTRSLWERVQEEGRDNVLARSRASVDAEAGGLS